VCSRFDEWQKQQRDRAEQLYGALALPASTPRAASDASGAAERDRDD
jgi:hypothetical protein